MPSSHTYHSSSNTLFKRAHFQAQTTVVPVQTEKKEPGFCIRASGRSKKSHAGGGQIAGTRWRWCLAVVGLGRGRAGRRPLRQPQGRKQETFVRHLHPGQRGGKAGQRPVESQNLNLCRSEALPVSLCIAPISNMILNASQTQKSPRAVMFPGFCVGCFYNQEKNAAGLPRDELPCLKAREKSCFFSLSPTAGASTPKAVETCSAGQRDLSWARLSQEMGRIGHFSCTAGLKNYFTFRFLEKSHVAHL